MGLFAHLNLNYLRVFLVVYKTGSMTKAAKELHLTQSGVSQQIKSLEDALSITLFDRISRRIVPTSEADSLFLECSGRLGDLEGALERISSDQSELNGTVKVGFPPIFGNHIVLPAIAEFSRKFPKVRFDLTIESNEDIIRLVLNGHLDFAFIDSFSKNIQLTTREIFVEYLDLYCHRNILGHFGSYSFDMEYFKKLPFIAYISGGPLLGSWFHQNFDIVPRNLNIIASVMDMNALATTILQEMGVGLLPEPIFNNSGEKFKDIHLFKAKSRVANSIYVCHFTKRSMSRTAARCYQFLCEKISPPKKMI